MKPSARMHAAVIVADFCQSSAVRLGLACRLIVLTASASHAPRCQSLLSSRLGGRLSA